MLNFLIYVLAITIGMAAMLGGLAAEVAVVSLLVIITTYAAEHVHDTQRENVSGGAVFSSSQSGALTDGEAKLRPADAKLVAYRQSLS